MSGVPDLSAREVEVIALVVDGCSNKEIARSLHLSERTVHSHLARVMTRTATRNRTQLAVYALRSGIVPLQPPTRQKLSRSAD